MNVENQKEISPELKSENNKIATMFFLAALFSIFSTVFYKLFYKTESPRFQKYINMLMNWGLSNLILAFLLVILNVSERTVETIGFLNLCYCAAASGTIRKGSEFKFFFTIKFFKEE
jgi:hypothetical protein